MQLVGKIEADAFCRLMLLLCLFLNYYLRLQLEEEGREGVKEKGLGSHCSRDANKAMRLTSEAVCVYEGEKERFSKSSY